MSEVPSFARLNSYKKQLMCEEPRVATKEHIRGMSLALQALWKSALSKCTYDDSGLPSRELACVAYVRGCT